MPDFSVHLAGNPSQLRAVETLIRKLENPPAGVPALFIEAARNLRYEQHLPAAFWKRVAAYAELGGLTDTYPDVEQSIVKICQDFTRRGERADPSRAYYGRAILDISLLKLLENQGVNPLRAQRITEDLPTYSADEARLHLKGQPLGAFLMWSTYCESCDCDEPFSGADTDADLIDSLGLRFQPGDIFYLFTYTLPPRLLLTRPTVADAYGGEFYFAFRTNTGRTHPIRYADRLHGRPELVHLPITGSRLVRPIQPIEPVEQPRVTSP